MQLAHKISHFEIKYGILSLRERDGTKKFFEGLPTRFVINLRGEKFYERKLLPKTIWIGSGMKKFRPYEIIILSKDDSSVTIT